MEPNYNNITEEIFSQFPKVDKDLMPMLLESTEGNFTKDIYLSLLELQQIEEGHVFEIKKNTKRVIFVDIPCVCVGCPVFFTLMEKVEGDNILVIETPQKMKQIVHCVFVPREFGIYTVSTKTTVFEFLVVTPIYEYAIALDDLHDSLFWGWDKVWTQHLEISLQELLIAANEDFKQVLVNMGMMLQGMMSTGSSSMDDLFTMIQDDLKSALEEHDPGAVGRLHQTLYQFLQISMMYPLPQSLTTAIGNFEKAKIKNHKKGNIHEALQKASTALDKYVNHIVATERSPLDPYIGHLFGVKQTLGGLLAVAEDQLDLSPLWRLRIAQTMSHMNFDSFLKPDGKIIPNRICFWPILPIDIVVGRRIEPLLTKYTENLTDGTILVGSFMQFQIGEDIEKNASIINGLLDSGLGYAASSEGTLVALHGARRGALHLTPRPRHEKLHSRSKDIARLLRKAKREDPDVRLSLRISTDFPTAVAKLRDHHKQNWVTPWLEATWRMMMERGQFAVFELWLDENMIAADFGHPVRGGSFYVATRFFSTSAKKYSPGFLLALVETRLLRDAFDFKLWDLGTTDSSPQMAYKGVVANIYSRPAHLHLFRILQNENRDSQEFMVPQNCVIIEDIQETHLLELEK